MLFCQLPDTCCNLKGNTEEGRKTVSPETWVYYEVLAPLTLCVAGLEVDLCSPKGPAKPRLIKSVSKGATRDTQSYFLFATLLHHTLLCVSLVSFLLCPIYFCFAFLKFFLSVTLRLHPVSLLSFSPPTSLSAFPVLPLRFQVMDGMNQNLFVSRYCKR